MITFKEFLFESRKNPEQNPKSATLDQLKEINKKYLNDNIFVTFTDIHKFGINPQSKWSTPLGIYAYPLSYVIEKNLKVPFQANAKFIQVFKVLNMTNIWNLSNQEQTTEISRRLSKIISVVGSTSKDVWYSLYPNKDSENMDKHSENMDKQGIRVRKILTSIGLGGVIDPGLGIIHKNEPTQGVFFDLKNLQIVDIIRNNYGEVSNEVLHKLKTPNELSPGDAYKICVHKGRRIKVLEPIIMKDADYAYLYALNIIKGRWPEAEPIIMKDAYYAYLYALNIIEGRWPAAELYIMKEVYSAYLYALNIIKGRWPTAEPIIMTAAYYAYLYALYAIKGRWPEAEPIIMKDAYSAYQYALNIIKGRWPEAEPIIMKDVYYAYLYALYAIKGRWPAAEPYIMKDAYSAYQYALNIIKGRWPEAESYIKTTNYAEKYKEFLASKGIQI